MSGTMKMPSMEQAFAIAKASLRARNKARQDVQPARDRESAFYENGNGTPRQMAFIKKLMDGLDKNELRALDDAALYQQALDHFLGLAKNKGHVGNLDDQAKAAAASPAKPGPTADPVDPNTITAPGGLPHDESLRRFEEKLTTAANQKKAAKVLDIPALDPDAPPAPPAPPAATEAAPAEKPKRGRPKAAAAKADAPPAPPAVGGLPDDDEEDLRPAFLRQSEEDRKAEAVH